MNVASLELCKELRICSVMLCGRKHEAKGYCSMHYKRLKRTGKPIEAYPSKTTHGQTGTKEWIAWVNMRQRCTNPAHPAYKHYGARHITFSAKWSKFEDFIADMGKAPAKHYTIERIDNEKGYEPGNCKWATMKEQSNNTRRNLNYASRYA